VGTLDRLYARVERRRGFGNPEPRVGFRRQICESYQAFGHFGSCFVPLGRGPVLGVVRGRAGARLLALHQEHRDPDVAQHVDGGLAFRIGGNSLVPIESHFVVDAGVPLREPGSAAVRRRRQELVPDTGSEARVTRPQVVGLQVAPLRDHCVGNDIHPTILAQGIPLRLVHPTDQAVGRETDENPEAVLRPKGLGLHGEGAVGRRCHLDEGEITRGIRSVHPAALLPLALLRDITSAIRELSASWLVATTWTGENSLGAEAEPTVRRHGINHRRDRVVRHLAPVRGMRNQSERGCVADAVRGGGKPIDRRERRRGHLVEY